MRLREILRKCRGILGLSLTWGVAWALVFLGLFTIIGLLRPQDVDPGETPQLAMRIGAILGLVSGAVFGVVLTLAEGRRVLRELSVGRSALWGGLGSALFPLVTPAADSMVIVLVPIGAALAAGSVAIAKRADRVRPASDSAQRPEVGVPEERRGSSSGRACDS